MGKRDVGEGIMRSGTATALELGREAVRIVEESLASFGERCRSSSPARRSSQPCSCMAAAGSRRPSDLAAAHAIVAERTARLEAEAKLANAHAQAALIATTS